MSVKAMAWVWDQSRAQGTDRLVLLCIADSAEEDGSNSWPSVAKLAEKCHVSERTVQYAIRRLVDLGELEVEKQAGGGSHVRADRRPNRYRLTFTRGVQRGADQRDDGVQPEAPRGATGGPTGCKTAPNGVQHVAPNPSLIHPETSVDPSTPQPPKRPSTALAVVGKTEEEGMTFAESWEAGRGFPERRRLAGQITDRVMRERTPRPTNRRRVFELVQERLGCGWEPGPLERACIDAKALTEGALEFAYNAGRSQPRQGRDLMAGIRAAYEAGA